MVKPRRQLQLGEFFPYLLSRLAEDVSLGLAKIYAREYGLSIVEWRVIAQLAEHGNLNARQIVAFTTMEKSRVSRAVKNLGARDLLRQTRASHDSRAKDLSLTPSGLALYREIVPRALAWEQELLGDLDSDEYRQLVQLLERLGTRLVAMAMAEARQDAGAIPTA